MAHRNDLRERFVTGHPGSKRRGKGKSARQKRLDNNRARRDTMDSKMMTLNGAIIDEDRRLA